MVKDLPVSVIYTVGYFDDYDPGTSFTKGSYQLKYCYKY